MTDRSQDPFIYGYLASPVGQLLVAGDGDHVRLIGFPSGNQVELLQDDWRRDDGHFADAFAQLNAYFAKELTEFDFAIRFDGTPFQNQVWSALCEIPYGATKSYGDIAVAIGNPGASRAVGMANNANPLPIVVPCHRVIGADASLIGFGGGVETKQFLLDLENAGDWQPRLL